MPRTLQEIIDHAEELADLFESDVPTTWAEQPVAEYLLERAVLLRASTETDVRDAVIRSRQDGMTWKRIGEFLGTSAQAAQQRYGKMVDDSSSA
ncbi:MAG: hypothetical protein IPF42_07225 [Candidatus Microthrix sp.]|nr:hypothetical protein [Candidatus Microthrix sp.]